MMIERRQFLKYLGLSPWGAKKSIEDLKVDHLWNKVDGPIGHSSYSIPQDDSDSFRKRLKFLRDRALKHGAPKYVKREHWIRAQHVTMLDSDIESWQSVSLQRKIQLQRLRNYQKLQNEYISGLEQDIEREVFSDFMKKYFDY